MAYEKIIYKGKPAKLEIFDKKHKSFKSLSVYQETLRLGLRVPKLYSIKENYGLIRRVTEWVEGNTIHDEMESKPDSIELICIDLARYINVLRDAGGISPVDNHFKNFVWNNNSSVYIDLKKLFYETYDEHIMRMSKLCLKSCRGDRRKAFYFLRGYAEYRDVKPIIEDCDKRRWQWENMKGNISKIDPIRFGELKEIVVWPKK